jgi:hypothetical protein
VEFLKAATLAGMPNPVESRELRGRPNNARIQHPQADAKAKLAYWLSPVSRISRFSLIEDK